MRSFKTLFFKKCSSLFRLFSRRFRAAVLVAAMLCIGGALHIVYYGDGGGHEKSQPASGGRQSSAKQDAAYRRALVGTWRDHYQGRRTMTLQSDGTGTMLVELDGVKAALFAEELEFSMEWSVENGCLYKKSLGGRPADKVKLILKLMGDSVNEPILSLDGKELILLDENGVRRYTWKRMAK